MHLGQTPFLSWHVDGDKAWIDFLSAQLDDEFSPLFWRKRGFAPVDDFGELLLGSFMQRSLVRHRSAAVVPGAGCDGAHSRDDRGC
ncbi:MAG: hypothetical protein NTV51_12460 [Verrucomicrobia bacterium]|nr:hypothetical protein [Verrucomicrobiota bacterium]